MNHSNLIPNTERTPEELREMGRKGGIASGKARRRKKQLKEVMKILMDDFLCSEEGKELLEWMKRTLPPP
ncbi:MAG: hypothetical protein ACOX8H_01600 [Ruminococcus sp.]|jgi:hypothetical protein